MVDRIRELGWPGVVGNTDELLWHPEQRAIQERKAPKLDGLLRLLFEDYAPASRNLLGEERIDWLRRLPDEHREGDLVLLHASPGDLWRAAPPDADDTVLIETYRSCAAATVVHGHIHLPYVRRLDGLTVANSGSVGSPFDGDPRASYLIVEDDRVQVIRVAYDIEREVATLSRSGDPGEPHVAPIHTPP